MDTFVLILVFVVAPVITIYYGFNKDPCTGVMALIIYGLVCLIANAIMFIVGTNIDNVVSQKLNTKSIEVSHRPTKEEVMLAAIRKEALVNSES